MDLFAIPPGPELNAIWSVILKITAIMAFVDGTFCLPVSAETGAFSPSYLPQQGHREPPVLLYVVNSEMLYQ